MAVAYVRQLLQLLDPRTRQLEQFDAVESFRREPHRERHSLDGVNAELVCENLSAQPAARDPGRDADHQGNPGQRECLPAKRAADLP